MIRGAPYWSAVAIAVAGCSALCIAGWRHPGRWRSVLARVVGACLVADALSYYIGLAIQGDWSVRTSLPLALCDMAVCVAAVSCWIRTPLLVEITYFWGLAGSLQGIVTPDLDVGFPHLAFFQYVVGHVGIVLAAVFLVFGMGLDPRRNAVARVYVVTAVYTAAVGMVDATTGANYMFLRQPPPEWTLLRLLGPWPWYIPSSAAVAVVLLLVLNIPFWWKRRRLAEAPAS